MPHRSPARYLAPLALIAALLVTLAVVRSGGGSSPTSAAPAASTTSKRPASTKAKAKRTAAKPATGARGATYTVKAGDVLGAISSTTGVSVEDLRGYNGLSAATPLRVGQKLKLTP